MIYEDKIEQIPLRVSTQDMGGGSHIPASDILVQMINESSHINLLALVEVKDVHLTLEEIDEGEA